MHQATSSSAINFNPPCKVLWVNVILKPARYMFQNGLRCAQPILHLKCSLSVSTEEKKWTLKVFQKTKVLLEKQLRMFVPHHPYHKVPTLLPLIFPCCLTPPISHIRAKWGQTALWSDLLHLLCKYKQLLKELSPWRKMHYVHLKHWKWSGHRIPMAVFQTPACFNL